MTELVRTCDIGGKVDGLTLAFGPTDGSVRYNHERCGQPAVATVRAWTTRMVEFEVCERHLILVRRVAADLQ